MKITIWSDFACPYCYIYGTRLLKAIEKTGLAKDVVIDFRAYELNPDTPRTPAISLQQVFEKEHGLTASEATSAMQKIEAMGKEEGLSMSLEDAKYVSTFDAHRLMKLAEKEYDRGTLLTLHNLLACAYWCEGLSVADHGVLMVKAMEAGMDSTRTAQVLDSEEFAADVRSDEKAADREGVEYIPYMIFPGQFSGTAELTEEDFEKILKGEWKEVGATTPGHACGADGCRIAD